MNLKKLLRARSVLSVLALVAAGVLLGVVVLSGRETTVERTRLIMGTLVDVTAVGTLGEEELSEIVDEAFTAIERVDRLMSTYREDSDVSRVNAGAGGEPVPVDPEVMAVVRAAKEYGDLSDGMLDVTVLPLLQAWGLVEGEGRIPDAGALEKALSLVNYGNIVLDDEAGTIRLSEPGMRLDLGAIAKGYAVDCAVGVLRARGIARAIVNAGGDLYALGERGDGKPWRVGVQDPLTQQGMLATLDIADASLATSGNYEKFFTIDGKRYCHILNPRTGWPVEGMLSVTVLAETAMQADALATAVFVAGKERGLALVEQLPGVEAVLASYPAGGDETHYTVIVSSGLRGRLKELR